MDEPLVIPDWSSEMISFGKVRLGKRAAVIAFLTVLFGICLIWLTLDTLTTEDVKRIHAGMARKDVISLLGRSEDYEWTSSGGVQFSYWYVNDGVIIIEWTDALSVERTKVGIDGPLGAFINRFRRVLRF